MRACKFATLLGSFFVFFQVLAQEPSLSLDSASLPSKCVSQSADSRWLVVREFPQKSFPHMVPAGNYSGITHLHDDVYAVVSDQSDSALYFKFRIQVDLETGELKHVENLGGVGSVIGKWRSIERPGQDKGFDLEAITKVSDSTLVVASEGKSCLKEFYIETNAPQVGAAGDLWEWDVPSNIFYPNYGFESVSYDETSKRFWTISESTLRQDGQSATSLNGCQNKLRLLAFEKRDALDRFSLSAVYPYLMDAPSVSKKAQIYVMGVSELCVLPDGQILVLEREAFIPKQKLGAFCHCKLYVVNPKEKDSFAPKVKSMPEENGVDESAGTKDRELADALRGSMDSCSSTQFLPKTLLTEWNTSLSLFGRSFANYEGMCLGPVLKDGSQVLILLSDSQNQYAGVLKDWFKTIVIKQR